MANTFSENISIANLIERRLYKCMSTNYRHCMGWAEDLASIAIEKISHTTDNWAHDKPRFETRITPHGSESDLGFSIDVAIGTNNDRWNILEKGTKSVTAGNHKWIAPKNKKWLQLHNYKAETSYHSLESSPNVRTTGYRTCVGVEWPGIPARHFYYTLKQNLKPISRHLMRVYFPYLSHI